MKKRIAFIFAATCLLSSYVLAEPADEFSKSMDAFLQNDSNVEKIGSSLERVYRKKQEEQRQAAEREQVNKMEEQFKNPAKVDLGAAPVRGPADAKVTIVEFSEFQCPFCRKGSATMHQILEEYPKDVKWAFKHLPLPFHENAKPAALAAIAAQNQGKFWEMHDKLFENQGNLKEEAFLAYAKELGLNIEKFQADMKDPKNTKIVEDDAAQGSRLGVRGTPGFFVNGVLLSGAQPLPQFKAVIDRWLGKAPAPAAEAAQPAAAKQPETAKKPAPRQ